MPYSAGVGARAWAAVVRTRVRELPNNREIEVDLVELPNLYEGI